MWRGRLEELELLPKNWTNRWVLVMNEWEDHMQRQHILSLAALAVAAGLSWMLLTGTAQAVQVKLPPAGDCQSMVAATGGKGIWFGQFSGRYEDLRDWRYPLAARGCFASENACRRWTNQILSIADGPGLMSCRPYNDAR